MASHRKPRTPILTAPGNRLTTAGLATAALASAASATLLAPFAQAAPRAPKPTVEEIKKKVDGLYRHAAAATQKYNSAKERADQQRTKVDALLDAAAERTEKMNEARRQLGSFAAAQYRTGGLNPTAQLMLAKDPQQFVDRNHLMERLTSRQQEAVADYREQAAAAARQRASATEQLDRLERSQAALKASKKSVQDKLAEARELLSKLTAEEKARLAALERRREAEARRRAEELARQQAERERREREEQEERERAEQERGQTDGSGSGTPDGSTGGTYATQAAKAIAFARQQIGKPYVWGATGPTSYDCSGLTQAAWKEAGVDLPRTTWDQVEIGQRVATQDLQPGDLVFFWDDISHVGLYIGDGKMIHAPKPGTSVRVESIYYMPIYGSVRPA